MAAVGGDRGRPRRDRGRAGRRFNEPNPLTGNHGGPQTRDNFLAVVGGGPLVRQAGDRGRGRSAVRRHRAQPRPGGERRRRADGHAAAGPARAGRRARGASWRRRSTPSLLPAADAARAGGGAACARGGGLPLGVGGAARARPALPLPAPRLARRDRRRIPVVDRAAGSGRPPIARFTGRRKAFMWRGRGARTGSCLRGCAWWRSAGAASAGGAGAARRPLPPAARVLLARVCGAISSFKLERPVFGGRTNRAVDVSYRLGPTGRARLELRRGKRVIRRLAPTRGRQGGRAHRVGSRPKGCRGATTGCG